MTRLVVVGGGKMGEALIAGLIGSGHLSAPDLLVVEPDEARAAELGAIHGVETALRLDQCELDPKSFDALIAVKPATVPDVCRELAGRVGRILSIAAGVTTATMESALGAETPVVRSMPNTPALVGVGASAIAPGRYASSDDLDWAAGILGAVGLVERVDEKLLDAVTGLSGSGPAYLFLVAEALVDGGVAQGLPRSVAVTLAHQTIAGAGRLLVESGDQAAQLRANVTSPGGTTAAGLRALESLGVRSAFIEAVAAATARAHELG